MKITVKQGEKESIFHAWNETGDKLGTGWVFPAAPSDIYVEPRLDIFITIEIETDKNIHLIKDQLFHTLMNRAKEIKKKHQEKIVRVYHCCFANDEENLDYYSSKPGFIHDEGMYIIRKELNDQHLKIKESPGIIYKSLSLETDEEISNLIEKHKTIFRNSYSHESIKELKKKRGWMSIAALHDAEIIGNIMLLVEETSDGPIGWVEDLFVLDDWRNKGIARNLVTRGLRYFQDIEIEDVRIEVWSANERAMALYKQLGFEFYEETEASVGMFL
ncbi:MAG: GNAT family N-acetyltransferase [Bacillus sp. (in: Bacteria)]|nr:GNAT family N-acetyltransferase [Bacillus sp. (in: firmicutes)]